LLSLPALKIGVPLEVIGGDLAVFVKNERDKKPAVYALKTKTTLTLKSRF
jgi:hypothetical protein